MRTWIDVMEDLSFFNCQMFAGGVVVIEVVEVESETPEGEEKGWLGMREISQYETT